MVDNYYDKKVYLNKNIVSTILKNNGLFCNHIPYCFSTDKLSEKIEALKDEFKEISVNKNVFPLTFTMNKNSLVRRVIGVPNVFSYLKLLFHLEDNWGFLKNKSYSKNSESRINILLPKHYNTNLKASLQTRHKKFVGYKIKLNLDISNCFDSIYTHSITWALLGKNKAKELFVSKDKTIFTEEENNIYKIADKFDHLMQDLNGRQTNGIITGPYASVIFSEIILAEIDRILAEKEYNFTRYVDDYNFYFVNENLVQPAMEDIAKILKEYNFLLNTSKIKKENYPFDLSIDYQGLYLPYLKKGEICNALYKALEYYKNGEEGAITYLLKMLESENFNGNFNIELILNLILNIVINVPKVSSLGIKILEQNMTSKFISNYKKILNLILNNELSLEHYHESMWLFYIIGKKKVSIDIENLKLIFKSNNDFLIIMALNYIQENINYVYEHNNHYLGEENVIKCLADSFNNLSLLIQKEDLRGQHWLLLYELAYHNYSINGIIKIDKIKKTKLYQLLNENDINFYIPF